MEDNSGKPISMTHRDWFVKKLCKNLSLSESIVDAVVKHQFESIVNATHKHSKLEISGFGVIMWNERLALRKLEYANQTIERYRIKISDTDNELEIARCNRVIDDLLMKRQMLMNKIYEFNPNLRGVEE
jgi:nucleoid DNA-binding protein